MQGYKYTRVKYNVAERKRSIAKLKVYISKVQLVERDQGLYGGQWLRVQYVHLIHTCNIYVLSLDKTWIYCIICKQTLNQ